MILSYLLVFEITNSKEKGVKTISPKKIIEKKSKLKFSSIQIVKVFIYFVRGLREWFLRYLNIFLTQIQYFRFIHISRFKGVF